MAHRLAQAVDVELDTADFLADPDQLLDLCRHVAPVVLEVGIARPGLRARRAGARNVEREGRDLVHALPDLRPLDVGVAGVGVDGERRLRDPPHGQLAAAQLRGDVGLHVAADVG